MIDESYAKSFVLELGNRVRAGAAVTTGEKTTLGDCEVLPVALSIYGFGGGAGSGTQPARSDDDASGGSAPAAGEGAGGGGGSWNVPLGAYVGRGDTVRFEANEIVEVIASIPIVAVVGVVAYKIVKTVRATR